MYICRHVKLCPISHQRTIYHPLHLPSFAAGEDKPFLPASTRCFELNLPKVSSLFHPGPPVYFFPHASTIVEYTPVDANRKRGLGRDHRGPNHSTLSQLTKSSIFSSSPLRQARYEGVRWRGEKLEMLWRVYVLLTRVGRAHVFHIYPLLFF